MHRLRFLGFIYNALLPNSHRMNLDVLLVMGVQQREEIFSVPKLEV
jgi:hypothetical protein